MKFSSGCCLAPVEGEANKPLNLCSFPETRHLHLLWGDQLRNYGDTSRNGRISCLLKFHFDFRPMPDRQGPTRSVLLIRELQRKRRKGDFFFFPSYLYLKFKADLHSLSLFFFFFWRVHLELSIIKEEASSQNQPHSLLQNTPSLMRLLQCLPSSRALKKQNKTLLLSTPHFTEPDSGITLSQDLTLRQEVARAPCPGCFH